MFEPFADFCESMSIPVLIVPAGFDLSPPQINSNDGDEDEESSLEEYSAEIMDEEEDSWG